MTDLRTHWKLPTKADELRSLIQDAQRKGFNRRPANADVLAALDAADAQGYARAMGEVVEWCKTEARDEWRTWPRGPEYKSALADVARWAAAAEKEHEPRGGRRLALGAALGTPTTVPPAAHAAAILAALDAERD